nr:hypothetical protein [Tanacetum cinerariifolium]
MRGDKIEHVFETSSGLEKVFGFRLNMETLAPGLLIDANVVDCWGEVLNYEEHFRKTLSMFDGTYATDEERWENFSAQGSVQFKESVNGLALSGIDLAIEIKFATKILLHEINVHASKMLELAKEFDKLDPREKLSIVVEA